ncbi:DUF6261 family protein [Sunxiuqinia dokdonensis]|uniref:Uncharacterized protein n=1 Tax=Sunxiuqinia dokdonensis TaxID=1409788 RepID=A0A0L8VAB2_9BACT|nr:DUF6261 family protein [Sunxiuqinia dokdonensis]KOH45396.1 hypothetical protein NC99_17720 [Sunxiuqinia dokdonensis]
MLIKIIYSYFTLGNLTSLAEKIRLYLVQKFPEHPMLSIILAQLLVSSEKARQAVGSTTKQEHTQAVRQADKRRDHSYRSLRDHIRAGILRQNEAYRAACQALYPIFEKNDLLLYNLADGDETTAINSLGDDLSGPEEQAHLATANAVEWLQELIADNQNFILTSQQRSANRTVDTTVPDKQAADQLKKSLDLLCSALETMQAVGEPEGINEAVNEVNQYIKEANASARLSQ